MSASDAGRSSTPTEGSLGGVVSWCEKHEVYDCGFRGPCGDEAFLRPIATAVAESNASVTVTL